MIFTIHRNQLFEGLQKVQSAVERRNTVQILGNILCTVKDQYLSLCATDLEVGIKVTIPVQSSTDGRITLSARHFLDIVRELPERELTVTRKDNNWIDLVCGKSRFNVVSLSADEYPSLPNFEEKHYLDAKSDALIAMIDRTQFAASTDATRYHLNGIYFEQIENGMMRMTATDGHRLSFVDREVFLKAPDIKRGMIIPRKGLMELRKVLAEGAGSVGLAFERGYVFAHLDSTYLFVRLIDGEYPDYRPVIPKAVDKIVSANREEFTSALKRVSLLAHEKSRSVKMTILDGILTISSSNPDMGEAREEMDVSYRGEPLEISFNSKYLLECLSVLDSNELEFHLKDRLSPGILRGVGQLNHTYVIMPMRV